MHGRTRDPFTPAIAVIILALAQAAAAQTMSRFDMPAQSLADALRALGSQTNINVLFDPPLVAGRQVPALEAELTVDQALSRLLEGTGLKHEFLDDRTVVLEEENEPTTNSSNDSMGSGRKLVDGTTYLAAADTSDRSDLSVRDEGWEGNTRGGQRSDVTSSAAMAAPGIEEVIITAEKRSNSLQRTPLAVTALDADALFRSDISDMQDVSIHVPSFNFGTFFGVAKYSIRGISFSNLAVGADPSVAYHLNGVYVSRPAGQLGNFYDLQSVEVLRGPQGTLYGRNATAGAVNVITALPADELSGYVILNGGSYSRLGAEAAISGALAPGVSLRLAATGESRDGYGRNRTTGTEIDDLNTYGARLSLKLDPSDDLTAVLIADYDNENDNAYGLHLLAAGGLTGEAGSPNVPLLGTALGGNVLFDSRDLLDDYDPFYRREHYGFTADISWSPGKLTLRSITGYRRLDWELGTSIDQTDLPLFFLTEGETSDQFSQEFQLSRTTRWGRWTAGAYYLHEDMDGAVIIPGNFDGILPYGQYFSFYYGGGSIETDAYALYAQATIDLTERFSLTLGGRYSDERKSEVDLYTDFINSLDFLGPYVPGSPTIATPFRQSASFDSFTPKIGLEFQMSPETLLYATASKGFKAGGFNLGGAFTPPGEPDNPQNEPLDPETIKAFEIGLKTTLLDRRLRTNLAAFYYDYSNLQVSQVTSLTVLLKNAAAAEIYGAEAEITMLPTENLELDLAASWLHARFTEFTSTDPNLFLGEQDLAGASLPQAPDFSLTAAAQYRIPFETNALTLRAEVFWTDRNYFLEFNRDVLSQPAYTKVNLFATFVNEPGDWEVMGYCTNCFDEMTVVSGGESGAGRGYPITGVYAPPREFGVQLRKGF